MNMGAAAARISLIRLMSFVEAVVCNRVRGAGGGKGADAQ